MRKTKTDLVWGCSSSGYDSSPARARDGGSSIDGERKAKVSKVLGDGGYDCLASSGIEAGIKVGEDSDPNCGGSRQEGRCELI